MIITTENLGGILIKFLSVGFFSFLQGTAFHQHGQPEQQENP
jgi:hypothetical protein